MATETSSGYGAVGSSDWVGGAVGGLVGGVAFGAMLSMLMPDVIQAAVPGLFGLRGFVAGWAVHLSFSVLFGLAFGAAARGTTWADSVGKSTGAGLAFGALLWAVNIVFVWPVWLQAVGFPAAPQVPNVAVMPLVGHFVYGALLGGVYSAVE